MKNFESAAYRSRAYTDCNDISCIIGHKKHEPAHVQLQTHRYNKNTKLNVANLLTEYLNRSQKCLSINY
jgi:hypothetical protein